MAPKHILFTEAGESGATAYNYECPSEVLFKSNDNGQSESTAGDPRNPQDVYDGNGTGDAVGIDAATDTDYEYTVWIWMQGSLSAGNIATAMSLREGATVSTVDNAGSRIVDSGMEAAASRDGHGSYLSALRPSGGRDAEFAFQFGNLSVAAGSLLVMSNDKFRPNVLRFPDRENYEDFHGFTYTDGWSDHNWEDQTTGDEDIDMPKKPFTVPHSAHNELYLIIAGNRIENAGDHISGASTDNRYSLRLDGPSEFGSDVDVYNVRTDNTTAGATKTGRGYNYCMPVQNFEHRLQQHYAVHRLPAGDYEFYWRYNQHQNNNDIINTDQQYVGIWRLNHFRNWAYHQPEVAMRTHASSSAFQPTGFTTTIRNLEADSKVIILFSTSRHGIGGLDTNQINFRIQRDGVTLIDQISSDTSGGTTDNDSNTNPSTDNTNHTVHCMWVDEPGAGEHTYTIDAAGEVTNSMFNTRDDGSDGFKGGVLFVGELCFAQTEA